MKYLKRKDIESIEYAVINDDFICNKAREYFDEPDSLNYESFTKEITYLNYRFKWDYKPSHKIADLVFFDWFFIGFLVISEQVYKYLFIENPSMVSNMQVKKIKLIHKDNFAKYTHECTEPYYLVTPQKIIYEDDKNNTEGIFWYLKRNSFIYKNKEETSTTLRLCISDNFLKEFKKQKFEGFVLEKEEVPIVKEEQIIYFESSENDYEKKINEWVKEFSGNRILKSKCKYIYYTVIEEENGYVLGVAGYLNKYFDDETYSFNPNMCDLTKTNLGKPSWQDCLNILHRVLQDIYKQFEIDFFKIKSFIGFHDSDIYNIN